MPPNPSAPTLEIGSTLAHFELLEVLGEGGMGIVFRAQDTIIRRQVALKVMQPHLAKQSKSKERFLREARTAAAVEHDRIVRIHEVNEDRGVPYIAMELLKGQSLDKKLIESSHLPLSFIFRVVRQVAEGLAEAHEKGLIHRDIKPSNVWLEPWEGSFRCKILDFGLARAADGDSISTKSGQMMGTPSYMAPEQWKGKEVDSRADLYSVGVMLYQMTTGKTPYEAESHYNLMYQVLHEEAKSPQELNPQLPPPLCDLIKQLMAKEKQNRPAKAIDIIRSLDQISKQITDLARELTTGPQEAIAFADTRSARQSDTHRPQKQNDRSDVFQTLPLSSSRINRWLPWLGMFVGLVVGISGIVIATQKQTFPDRSAELTQLLADKSQLEEQLKQLQKDLSGIEKKTPQEMEEERKRLKEYDFLVKEKQKLEGDLTQLQTKLAEEQKANGNQKSELGKTIEKQKADLKKAEERVSDYNQVVSEKQKVEAKLKEVEGKVNEYVTKLAEADKQEKLRKIEFDQLSKEKGKLESEIVSLKLIMDRVRKGEFAQQAPKQTDLLDCTGPKGADEKTVKAAQKAWAEKLGVPVETNVDLGDGVKMEFVLIPPGKYLMGATKEEQDEYTKTVSDGKRPEWLDWELAQHEVTISKPFYMGKYEVTQKEYLALMKLKNPSWFSKDGNFKEKVKDQDTNRFPVETVSWNDAKKYWERISKQRLPKKVKGASLPTEAQWEYACRAGTRTAFHFGDVLDGNQANCDGNNPFGTTRKGRYLERTTQVDSKDYEPNAFGLHQMHGNVWEWCLDGWNPRAYDKHQKSDPLVDQSDDNRRVLRGGSWVVNSRDCRSAYRGRVESSVQDYLIGFRLVLLFED